MDAEQTAVTDSITEASQRHWDEVRELYAAIANTRVLSGSENYTLICNMRMALLVLMRRNYGNDIGD